MLKFFCLYFSLTNEPFLLHEPCRNPLPTCGSQILAGQISEPDKSKHFLCGAKDRLVEMNGRGKWYWPESLSLISGCCLHPYFWKEKPCPRCRKFGIGASPGRANGWFYKVRSESQTPRQRRELKLMRPQRKWGRYARKFKQVDWRRLTFPKTR